MHIVKASEFKARCLALMDEVAQTGEAILITKNGKPVAELRPHASARRKSPFGLHQGLVKVHGDIVAPLDDGDWEAAAFFEKRAAKADTAKADAAWRKVGRKKALPEDRWEKQQ